MLQKSKNRRVKKFVVFLMLIVICCMLFPPPVYIMAPGETKSTEDMIGIEKISENSPLFYTTVLLKPTNWGTVMQSLFNSNEKFVMKNQVLQGKSLDEYKANAQLSMYESFNQALEAAYNYLDEPYSKQEGGLYVSERLKSSSLFVGDQLMSVVSKEDIYHIKGLKSLLAYINQLQLVDNELKLIVKSGQATREVMLSNLTDLIQPVDERQFAAWMKVERFVNLEDVVAEQRTSQISINAERVGGASAGLVMTLAIIDALNSDELHTNQKIAATGTMTVDGNVGIIGGIEQKVVSVHEAGMDIFIVPQQQLKAAQKKAKSLDSALKIVGVSTLSEAIETINHLQ